MREVCLNARGVEKGGEESATGFQCWSTDSDVGGVNVNYPCSLLPVAMSLY